MDAGSGDSTWLDPEHWEATRRESRDLRQLAEQARARARLTRHQVRMGWSRRKPSDDLVFPWLEARMGTMPVIEQAKGIVMAQQRCGPDEAFDVLRRASQRANVKLRILAAQIVERTASGGSQASVTPVRLGTRRHRRAGTADPPRA